MIRNQYDHLMGSNVNQTRGEYFLCAVTRYSHATLLCLAILNRKRKISENLDFRTIQWIIPATKIE